MPLQKIRIQNYHGSVVVGGGGEKWHLNINWRAHNNNLISLNHNKYRSMYYIEEYFYIIHIIIFQFNFIPGIATPGFYHERQIQFLYIIIIYVSRYRNNNHFAKIF